MNQSTKKLYSFLYKYYYLKVNYANDHPELFKCLDVHQYADSNHAGVRSEALHPYTNDILRKYDHEKNTDVNVLDRFPFDLADEKKTEIANVLAVADNEFEKHIESLDQLDAIAHPEKVKQKPKMSDRILKRNQEIIDKCYELEKQQIQPSEIYKRVSQDYQELKPGSIKRIRLDTDAPSPTKVKK